MVAFPKLDDPSNMSQIAPIRHAVMLTEEFYCRSDLSKLDVQYRDLPPIRDCVACGID